jgi:hypothetical protein
MDKNILNLVESMQEMAADVVADGGQCPPMFALFTKKRSRLGRGGKGDQVVMVEPPPYNSPAEKRVMVAQVRAVAKRLGAFAVVFMTEAWAARPAGGKDLDDELAEMGRMCHDGMLREHSTATEQVMILVQTYEGNYLTMGEIVTDMKTGERSVPSFDELEPATEFSGGMANILPQKSRTVH